MARKRNNGAVSVSDEMGESDLLEEAATKRLSAAEKLSRADALLKSRNEDEDESQPDPEPIISDPEPEPYLTMPEPTKLERILKALNGEGKVEIYKLIAGAKSRVGVYPIEDYPDIMESIAREHGGGEYKVLFKDAKGNYAGSDTATFDPKAYGKRDDRGSDSNAMMERMLTMMEKKEQGYMLQIEQLRRDQTALMLEVVKGQSSNKGTTATEVLTMLKAAKELSGKDDSPLQSVKELLEVVAVLNNNGVGEPASPITTAIDKAFQLAGPLIGAWAAKMAVGGASPQALPNPGQTALPPPRMQIASDAVQRPTPSPISPAEPPTPTPEPKLKGYAQSLLAAASAGQSYSSVAQAILDMVPDEDLDSLSEMVSDPGFVAQMLAVEPALSKHQVWLAQLCTSIKDGLETSPDPDAPPAPSPAFQTAGPALNSGLVTEVVAEVVKP